LFGIGSTGFSGLPDWRSAAGQDFQSIDADPQFIGALPMGDFRFASTSPAQTLHAGADYEGEEADAVLQMYRISLTQGLQP
jgi:hypothetical protein